MRETVSIANFQPSYLTLYKIMQDWSMLQIGRRQSVHCILSSLNIVQTWW